jgi:hypothetical protein
MLQSFEANLSSQTFLFLGFGLEDQNIGSKLIGVGRT